MSRITEHSGYHGDPELSLKNSRMSMALSSFCFRGLPFSLAMRGGVLCFRGINCSG